MCLGRSKIYVGDKLVATLWTCDPSQLPPHRGKGCVLKGWGPLFNLSMLQARLRAGLLDLDLDQHCWVATRGCWNELLKLTWTPGHHLRRLLLALRPGHHRQGGDFVNAQWCQDSNGALWACDAYRVHVDEYNDFRRTPNGLAYYVKFSIDESGALCLVLIQCHLDRYRSRA